MRLVGRGYPTANRNLHLYITIHPTDMRYLWSIANENPKYPYHGKLLADHHIATGCMAIKNRHPNHSSDWLGVVHNCKMPCMSVGICCCFSHRCPRKYTPCACGYRRSGISPISCCRLRHIFRNSLSEGIVAFGSVDGLHIRPPRAQQPKAW
jgi:hypothetical protein